MAVITIREQSQTETGFNAILFIEGNNYPITVSDPFTEKQEQELEWYFEDWLCYPMLDNVKADRAKISVDKYGEELFKQVFQRNIDAYNQYSQIRNNLNQVQIEIESITPEFHAIHWEALQDPELSRPLAIDSVFMRKSVKSVDIAVNINESPTINLLVVVARPKSDRDIPHRTISRPLVEAIRNAKLRVNIEILRPGTYEALARHLETKESGYYHIVHFDVHGALKDYDNYKYGIDKEIYLKPRDGREEIKPYQGVRAFLALEGNEIGEYDLVEASEIADLLTRKDIPVCILNACQSGKQLRSPLAPLDKGEIENEVIEDNRETSLGSRLMNAGMQMVVAMSYSVTVTAAEIIMQQIYTHLFDNQDLNQAIRLGRKELYNRKARKAAYNTAIELEDWLLPVVYCNGEVTFNLREFTPEEKAQYDLNLKSKYEFTEPTYGFVGRDIDILLIEKALLQHNILLLQGMGGTGKSTLLNYLREWWQVTKFAQDIFYFGYDKRACTLEQIFFEISKQLYNQFDFERFQAKNINEQWQELSNKFHRESYILILDNLESITGKPLAIQNTLDETAREEIKKFLASLVGGTTKVVLGSRIAEQWLQESTFRDNSYQLRGLDAQARTNLAENILQRVNSSQSIDEIKTDEHFQRLMRLLAGYPLAMGVVLSNLKNQSPQEILENLEKAEINPGGEDKESNIIKCIEYSYNNLSDSAQKLLVCLAPFRSFLDNSNISDYVEQLKKIKSFQDYNLEKLEHAINEALNWGLLSSIDNYNLDLLSIHPLLPYFLDNKLRETNKNTRKGLREGFRCHCRVLASNYDKLMQSKELQKRQLGIFFVNWEYENLYQALQICLRKEESVYDIWICLYFYLELISDKKKQLQLTENVDQKISKYTPKCNYKRWERDIITIKGNLAKYYLENLNYQKSKDIYRNVLDLLSQFNNIEKSQKQSYFSTIYHQLGIVAEELRQFQQARDYYQKSLDIKIKYNDHYQQAKTYYHLGRVAEELEQFQSAQDYYQHALAIYIEYRDHFYQAYTYHQLGMVAQKLGEYEKAKDYYQRALNIFIEYNDLYEQAKSHYQLGRLAQILEKYKQAENYYQQALGIYIEYKERLYQAKTYHQLGRVSQELGEYKQAENYYQQALNIYVEYNKRFYQAIVYGQLGILAKDLSEFEQAKNYYLQALEMFVESKNNQYLDLVISKLADLYQKTEDSSLISEVAAMFNMTEAEVRELFDRFNG